MFEIGFAAVERVSGRTGVYFCPICGRPFDKHAAVSGTLTEEHVPPASVGGRVIALTCKRCNSKAGHTAEAELHRREQNRKFIEFMQGRRDGYARDLGIEIADTEVTIAVERDSRANRMDVRVIAERNDPSAVERTASALSQLAARDDVTGTEFRVRSKVRYHPRLAKVAELKAAFLVAFAVFGFRYALSSALLPVRKQIWSPSENVLNSDWSVRLDTAEEHLLVFNDEPECLVVKLGASGVLLPWVTSPDGFYEELRTMSGENNELQMRGVRIPWPNGMQLLLDGLGVERRGQ